MLKVQYIILDKLEFDSAVGKAYRGGVARVFGRKLTCSLDVTMGDFFYFIHEVTLGELATWAINHMPEKLVHVFENPPYTLDAVVAAAFVGFPQRLTSKLDNYLKRFRRERGYESEGQGSYAGVAGVGRKSSLESRSAEHAAAAKEAKSKPKYVAESIANASLQCSDAVDNVEASGQDAAEMGEGDVEEAHKEVYEEGYEEADEELAGVHTPTHTSLAPLKVYPTSFMVEQLRKAAREKLEVRSLGHFLAANAQPDVKQTFVAPEEELTCWGILTHMLNVEYIILDKLEVESMEVTMETVFRLIRLATPGEVATWAIRYMPEKLVEVYSNAPWTQDDIVNASLPGYPKRYTSNVGVYHKRFRREAGYEKTGSYTGVAGIGQGSSFQTRGKSHSDHLNVAKANPKYVRPAPGTENTASAKDYNGLMYQFWAHEHIEGCDTVHVLEVPRADDGPIKGSIDEALLLMEATLRPLNVSVQADHSHWKDSRYSAVLPAALLAKFGLFGEQPLSALAGPMNTVPLCHDLPTRNGIRVSTNRASKLIRRGVVPVRLCDRVEDGYKAMKDQDNRGVNFQDMFARCSSTKIPDDLARKMRARG
ncbi:hypothetical protein LTR56_000638 [Elasticomyces elasticus]|nr:hypothetical protein LTR56_000638 [Elasticomyces elasticus]